MNDRQRLEAIVDVVRSYLPPNGISREEAMSQIIGLVDPLPEQLEQAPVGMTCKVWTHGCALFDGIDLPNETLLYTAPLSKPWVSLSDREITGAAHNETKYPVSILETTDSGLCMQFSETGEWHASDKRGDFMKVNGFLMSFARAIEAALRSKNT